MNNAHLDTAFDRTQSPGVHDVAIDVTITHEAFVAAICARQRGVAKENNGKSPRRRQRAGDHHTPSSAMRWRSEPINRAAARREHRRNDVVGTQDANRRAHGEAFTNAARIQLDPGRGETDRAHGGVKSDLFPAGYAAQRLQLLRGRNVAIVAKEPPGFHETSYGDVKRTVTPTAPILRLHKKTKSLGIGRNWRIRGVANDTGEFAALTIIRKQVLYAIYFIEDLLRDRSRVLRIVVVQIER